MWTRRRYEVFLECHLTTALPEIRAMSNDNKQVSRIGTSAILLLLQEDIMRRRERNP